ncbi:hypothetical protein ES706_06738 [subsurface metagenome]
MNQTQFALRRNELIAKYLRSIRPLWEKYQNTLLRTNDYNVIRRAYKLFQAAIQPHLELLFARIAKLKQQLEVNPK